MRAENLRSDSEIDLEETTQGVSNFKSFNGKTRASLPRLLQTFPRPFDDDINSRLVFGDHVRGQDAAPEDVRIDHRAAPEDAAGVQHGVAAGFRAVAHQRAELAQAGVKRHAVHLHLDVAGKQFVVGYFNARAEVRLVTEDGVADVIEVCRVGAIEQQRVFQFGRIADDAAVADDDVFADVGVVADLATLAGDGRDLDHGAVLDDGAFADENFFTDECPALAGVVPGRFQIGGDVALNFFERVPGEFAAVENGGVSGLAEVKQVGWLEHGVKLGETAAAEKRNGAGVVIPFGGARLLTSRLRFVSPRRGPAREDQPSPVHGATGARPTCGFPFAGAGGFLGC